MRVLCLRAALLGLAALVPVAPARAEPAWTTYHHDAQRSGYDAQSPPADSPALAWQSQDLGAPIWGQPLVLGERVYVATTGDRVYALEAATGRIVWQRSLGTPVPAGALPCGDITPTVGIVGTPVIDPAVGALYAVADTWDAVAEEAHHLLEGLRLSDGAPLLSTPVDPPGSDPKTLLQRTALNLDEGDVVFGFGGNDGDCGEYRGAVVEAPETGGPARFWQYRPAAPSPSGGAVWATSGAALDGSGRLYVATGNPNPPAGERAETYDYSDSALQLDLARDFTANPLAEPSATEGWFEPPSWEGDSNSDLDLGSAGPELLPGGLLFQAGKTGVGYLIAEATMSSGAQAVFSHEVCNGAGSFGGDAYANAVVYIPCTNGTQALAYDQSTRTFTPLWQGPADAFGPPIVAGGLVWTVATGGFGGEGQKLYGLDPADGAPRYTETLPSPVADHFASPSAAGGRLFLATGSTVSAYSLGAGASSRPGEGEPQAPPAGASPAPAGSVAGTVAAAPAGSSAAGAPTSRSPHGRRADVRLAPLLLVATRLRARHGGRVRIALRCTRPRRARCAGTVRLQGIVSLGRLRGTGSRRDRELVVGFGRARFGPRAGRFAVTLQLDRRAMALLRGRHATIAVRVVLSMPSWRTRRVGAMLS
jgi:outer membrane protein assembly factor BamB